jgi:ATP-binding cassette subfamily B protein
MSSVLSSASWRSVVPDEWQAEVQSKLQPNENATAWVLVDLNAALKFHKIALILTDRRILTANLNEKNWQSWSLTESQRLRQTDHAGVGQLELSDAQGRLAVWRFTLCPPTCKGGLCNWPMSRCVRCAKPACPRTMTSAPSAAAKT